MKYAPLLAISLLVTPALADDPSAFLGCRGEISGGGQSQVLDGHVQRQIKQASVGAGCNTEMGRIISGGAVRLNFGAGSREIEMQGKVGMKLNDGVFLYLSPSYTANASTKFVDTKNGVFALGAGAEFVVTKNVSAFMEAFRDVAKIGTYRDLNEQTTVRAGTRMRF